MDETRLIRIGDTVVGLETKMDQFAVRQHEFATDLRRLEQTVDTRMDDLERHMLVLHEDLVDRIKALANPDAPARREVKDGLDALREATNRRLDPLEGVVREHSREIDRLKRRDGSA